MPQNQQNKTILTAIKQVKNMYMKRGFNLTTLLMDGQFESLRGDLASLNIRLNTVASDEHMPEVRWTIYPHSKETSTLCIQHAAIKQMSARMTIEMIYYSVFWLNSFPTTDGISDMLSPHAFVIGTKLNYTKNCRLEFGTYAQVHEEHDNSKATCTTGATALRPRGNA